jgi:N-acetylmuramoyl-L-alanine amidase
MSDEDRRRAAALEAQRLKRVKRRQERRRRRTVSAMGGLVRSFIIVFLAAALMATILSWWTNPDALDPELRANLQDVRATDSLMAAVPTGRPTPNWLIQIGIVSGHRGPENDPGAVCMENGVVTLTENEVNFAIAQQVVRKLRQRGYSVDLLDEFDPRLDNYRGAALVSIHSNDCQDYGGERPSGFLVSHAESRADDGPDGRLTECVAAHYGQASGLQRRMGLTRDMTDYHVFREIDARTPGTILETGFMLADRELITGQPEMLAQAVVDGILCFLNEDAVIQAAATPAGDAP